MSEPTAVEVLALSALRAGRPLTSRELAHAGYDLGMHLTDESAAATVASLVQQGLAEPTPAASLGKFRTTAQGRAWLAARTAPAPGSGPGRER